jgi:site-specific recombinase XerD
MIEDMQLRGLAVRTQESYLLAVRQLARHYQKSPDQINEEELRQYFLFLKNDKHASRSTYTINLCGIKFFFQHTLGREWKTFEFVRPPREKKLPVVLSVAEVRCILGLVHRQHYRACLSTIYACGLLASLWSCPAAATIVLFIRNEPEFDLRRPGLWRLLNRKKCARH